MEIISDAIDQLNWWAIIVATLSTLPVGYVWYDMKIGFGKPWAEMSGLTKEDIENKDGMGIIFAVMLLTSLITAFFVAVFLVSLGVEGFADSFVVGLVFGFIFRGGAHFIHNGFTRQPMSLTLIDAVHDLVSVLVMSLILGLWV